MLEFSAYQDPRLLKVLEEVYKIKRVELFDTDVLNTATSFYRSCIKKGDIFNTPFGFYYTPTIQQGQEVAFADGLHAFSKTHNTNIRIKSFIALDGVAHQVCANNPIIDLRAAPDYSKNHKQNIKRNTNKCARNGIEILRSDSLEDLRNFYNNVLSVMYVDKHKMIFQPWSLYQKLFEAGFFEFFIAKKDDEILGGLLCIKDNKLLHYNWGASLNYQNIALGTVLINHAVEYARENGYAYFDLGATALSDHDLHDFKMKWGGTNHLVYEHYTLTKPDHIDLNNSYQFARNIYALFPKPFLRWLMPRVIPWLVQ